MMIKMCNILAASKKIFSISMFMMILLTGCAGQMENKSLSDIENPELTKFINSITTEETEDVFNVYLRGSQNLVFTSVKQPFPTGVILYFPNTKLDNLKGDLTINNSLIEAIRSSEYNQDKQTARIEILLKQDIGYRVSKIDDGLLISFKKNSSEILSQNDHISENPGIESRSSDIVLSEEVGNTLSIVQADFKSNLNVTKTQPIPVKMVAAEIDTVSDAQENSASVDTDFVPEKAAWMNRIDFSSETNGKSTLIIGTTVPVQYKIKKKSPINVELQLINTNIPKYRQRPLITTRFQSAVDRILPFQTSATGKSSIVNIELRENVPYYIDQTSNLLMVHFEASTIPPRPLDEANLPDWQQVIMQTTIEPSVNEAVVEKETAIETVPSNDISNVTSENDDNIISVADPNATGTQAYAAGEFGTGKKKYIGEKIALDFYKTDIKNVFRILREVSGKNFAIDKDVSGSVTLTLDKPVPWDQVMDLVLKMNQLGMIYEQDIIRIATLDTLRREEDQRSAQLAAAKKAQQQKESLEPIYTEYIAVNYSQAAKEVLPHVKNILTKERGSVTVDGRNNQIIITDTRDVIRQAREIVRKIDKVTPQVVIEARIVEVSSSFSRELGIDWSADYGATYSDVLDMDFTGNLAMNFPSSAATSSIGINFSRLDGLPFVLNAKINALETQGDGKILSSPKIVTLDNKKAKIKQGLEYPYLERDDSGGSSVKFKNIDLLLEVTPHVTPDNRISMSIFITKNDVAGITDGVPSISTNEAETELLVNDGDTIVIGGIIKASESGGESGFPGLSKIPVLGWLFKNKTRSDQKNELLIFMTPRIVQLEQL